MKTVLKSIALGFLVSAALQLNTANVNAAVLTSFEPEEGFTPGGRSNTAGWTMTSTRIRVSNGTDEPAFEGSHSLRIEGGDSTVVATNWTWADAEEQLDTFSFSFTNPTATHGYQQNAAWVYIRLSDPTYELGARLLQLYVTYGNDPTSPYRIRYQVANGPNSVETVFRNVAQSSLNFADWNTLSAQFDFEAKTYSLTLQGTSPTPIEIASGIALPSSWNVTGVTGTQLVSPRTGATYYDVISATEAIPEPSTLGMLGLGALFLAGWNARRLARRPQV